MRKRLLFSTFAIVFTTTFFAMAGCSLCFGYIRGYESDRSRPQPRARIMIHQPLWTRLRVGGISALEEKDKSDDNTVLINDREDPSVSTTRTDLEPIVQYPYLSSSDGEEDFIAIKRVFVLMDCFTSYFGLYLAARIRSTYPDVALVYVLSEYMRHVCLTKHPDQVEQWNAAQRPTQDTVDAWKARIENRIVSTCRSDAKFGTSPPVKPQKLEWVGVYCESDSGLADAEELRSLLRVSCTDAPPVNAARRSKHLMNECVAHAQAQAANGLCSTVHQKLCHSLEEATAFASKLLRLRSIPESASGGVIVKPFRGCGSESVFLCTELGQVEDAWKAITHTPIFAETQPRLQSQLEQQQPPLHDSVLVQEYLQGDEYAVDVVARKGQYKMAALWKYDKRPVNGAPFCYFRTQLIGYEENIDDDDDVDEYADANGRSGNGVIADIAKYVSTVLKSLGVQWGLSHVEVIVTPDHRGPVLVEVNCRQHNMDFAPLTMHCIGYNALDMIMEAYLGTEDDWNQYPYLPSLVASGSMVHLVNVHPEPAILKSVQHLDAIRQLPSVRQVEVYEPFLTVGGIIAPTVDITTDAGWVQLVHEHAQQLEEDYHRIVDEWMPTMFRVDAESELSSDSSICIQSIF